MLQQAPRHLEPHPLSDYTVDVDVILKLHDLRSGNRMPKARGWLFGYKASAYYPMVNGYWDMAASFITYLSNLETVAQAMIDNMNSGDPKAYEAFSARVRGAGA
jgi:hypothetical protein